MVILIRISMRMVIVLMRKFLNVMASRGPIIIIVIMVQWLFGNWRISNGDRFDHLTIWKIVVWHPVRRGHDMRRALMMVGMLDVASLVPQPTCC